MLHIGIEYMYHLYGLLFGDEISVISEPVARTVLTVVIFSLIFLYIVDRALHLSSYPQPPILLYNPSKFNNSVVSDCPLLTEPYVPPILWGKSGHFQTIIYGKLGRTMSPFPKGKRHSIRLEDGSTLTFDIFEPLAEHPMQGDYTMLICPGIGSSSESVYIRTFVDHAQNNGYRVAVLNHLGAMLHVKLTSPRIFTYGGTEEYGVMVDYVHKMYPQSGLLAIGFSMGGNIITKYLGEDKANQAKVLCGMSVCQGYDVVRCLPTERSEGYLMSWKHWGRIYIWVMTQNQKKIIYKHRDILIGKEAQQKYGMFDVEKVMAATSLIDIDENYSRRRAGFSTLSEYYENCSSKNYIDKIHVPMFILNALDDPIVPPELHDVPEHFTMQRDNVIFAKTLHGGHLGYFEGGVISMHPLTWLDKVLVQVSHSMVNLRGKKVE